MFPKGNEGSVQKIKQISAKRTKAIEKVYYMGIYVVYVPWSPSFNNCLQICVSRRKHR